MCMHLKTPLEAWLNQNPAFPLRNQTVVILRPPTLIKENGDLMEKADKTGWMILFLTHSYVADRLTCELWMDRLAVELSINPTAGRMRDRVTGVVDASPWPCLTNSQYYRLMGSVSDQLTGLLQLVWLVANRLDDRLSWTTVGYIFRKQKTHVHLWLWSNTTYSASIRTWT